MPRRVAMCLGDLQAAKKIAHVAADENAVCRAIAMIKCNRTSMERMRRQLVRECAADLVRKAGKIRNTDLAHELGVSAHGLESYLWDAPHLKRTWEHISKKDTVRLFWSYT